MCRIYYVFFFKQKTAYEVRISDWSSDVCSSDLSVLLVRGRDGEVRAFHNACTHRGNKLCQKFADSSAFVKGGNKKYFTCEFHGWVFSDKGDVVEITDQENYFDLDKQALELVPIHIAFWEGLKNGRENVCTAVTNANVVCRLQPPEQKSKDT